MYALLTLLAATAEAGIMAVVKAVSNARRRRAVARAAPLTAAQVAAQAPSPGGMNGPGRPRELTGRATHSSGGTLLAPLSNTPCVWYAILVQERFQAWRPGPLGPIRVERYVTLAKYVSGNFDLRDETGTVNIDPRGADLVLGEPAFGEFEPQAAAAAPDSLTARVAKMISTPIRGRHRSMTLGFLVQELVVRDAEELHVVGHLRSDLGEVIVGKRGMRPFVISRSSMLPTAG